MLIIDEQFSDQQLPEIQINIYLNKKSIEYLNKIISSRKNSTLKMSINIDLEKIANCSLLFYLRLWLQICSIV